MSETTRLLGQDKIWVDRFGREYDIETMDPKYRSNLIPFLRGNANLLQTAAREFFYATTPDPFYDDVSDGVASALARMAASFDAPAETWLEQTPLMRRLVALEQGVPLAQRKLWALQNKAYEIRHGYKKVRHS